MSYKIVIPSARASNLIPCVKAIQQFEPELAAENILVVDDGARQNAEAHLPGITWIQGIKPFIYARNVNLAISQAGSDVILLNDDARLMTFRGFAQLSEDVMHNPCIGVCSASIHGLIGNLRQRAEPAVRSAAAGALAWEPRTLAFVSVFIPRRAIDRLGLLDEQFRGYGWEDNDYCRRARDAGMKLAISRRCVVDHSGELPSTFRTRQDIMSIYSQNQRLYQTKWGGTL